jgi:hypothetical protein
LAGEGTESILMSNWLLAGRQGALIGIPANFQIKGISGTIPQKFLLTALLGGLDGAKTLL